MADIYSGIEEYNDGTEYYRPYGTEDYQVEHYRGAMKLARGARKMRKFKGLAGMGKKFKFAGKLKNLGKFSGKFGGKFGKAGRKFKGLSKAGGKFKGSSARLKKLRKLRKARKAGAKARKARKAARLRKLRKLRKMRKMRKAKKAARAAAKKAKKGLGKGAKLAKKGGKKGLKLVKKGGKKAAKFAKKHSKLLKYAALAGAIGGGALFLDKKYKDRDKKVKECASICLPKNWDAFDQKKIKSTELQYKTLEEVKAAGAVDDQPVCSKDIGGGKCESHCITKCEEITKLDLGAPLNAVTGAAGKVAKAGLNVAGKAAKAGMNVAGKILGPIWKKIKMPFMIILVLIILSVVMKFMPKGRPRAPPPAVY